jgi:1-acyl-sn-glycerol-3-phosphate acyltransferase
MNKLQQTDKFSLKYRFVRFILLSVTFFLIKKINGIENLPKNGPYIIVANHSSVIDPLFILVYLSRIIKRHIHFLAKAKYYNFALFRFLIELTESIAVSPKEEARSIYIALGYLKHSKIVGIFPEGTRSPDGTIRRGRPGVASLALSAKVPVVPVGLVNTYKIFPRGKVIPRYARCEINIGEPLEFGSYYNDYDEAINKNDREKSTEIEEKVVRGIMKEIAKLLYQEYSF